MEFICDNEKENWEPRDEARCLSQSVQAFGLFEACPQSLVFAEKFGVSWFGGMEHWNGGMSMHMLRTSYETKPELSLSLLLLVKWLRLEEAVLNGLL